MATPTWLAGTTGQTILAGQDNQFLGTHAISYIYPGRSYSSQANDGSAAIGISAVPPASGFTRLAESFTTFSTQTTLGYLQLYGKKVGNGCDLTVELYTNSSSKPGAQVGLNATTFPAEFWTTSNGWVNIPLPISGLSSSTLYHVVLISGDVNGNNSGDALNYISIEKSNGASGASTYTTGTWTAQAYGFMYIEWDNTPIPPNFLTAIYEDAGARWTSFVWLRSAVGGNGGVLTGVYEYTISQGTGQMRSARTITLPGNTPTVVA
jgi:hypothetical protein